MKNVKFVVALSLSFICFNVEAEHLSIEFLDVGYADSIIINTPENKIALVDAGDQKKQLTVLLQKRKISNIEKLIITHPHENHFNAVEDLLEQVQVRKVYINPDSKGDPGYQELLSLIRKKNIKIQTVQRAAELKLTETVLIKILHPKNLINDTNANSLATWIEYKNTNALLLSDILEEQQKNILKAFPFIKKANIVQIAHHGDFLIPELRDKNRSFVVSVGSNKWGAPNEKLLASLGDNLYRTDRDGTISLKSDGKRWMIQKER